MNEATQNKAKRPTEITVEVTYTVQFTKTIKVNCEEDRPINELIADAIEDIEIGSGEYVDSSWETLENTVVDESYLC